MGGTFYNNLPWFPAVFYPGQTFLSQVYQFTFLFLDPSQFWKLNGKDNLVNQETLELLTDSDGISNYKFVSDDKVNYYIENSTHVLEADFKNKVKVNTKDKDNRRQLWKKGCPNYKGFFMIENSESRMLLTVATDASKSIELIGLFKTL